MIVLDDTIADMLSYKTSQQILTELFIGTEHLSDLYYKIYITILLYQKY